jgi:hypothetical protein
MGHLRILGHPVPGGYVIEASVGTDFHIIYGMSIIDCVSQLKERIEGK